MELHPSSTSASPCFGSGQVHPDVLPVLKLARRPDVGAARATFRETSFFPPGGGHALPDAVGDAGVKPSD